MPRLQRRRRALISDWQSRNRNQSRGGTETDSFQTALMARDTISSEMGMIPTSDVGGVESEMLSAPPLASWLPT